MRDALLALHFQNDICHRDGLIPFSLDRSTSAAANFLSASKSALDEARRAGWTIAHIPYRLCAGLFRPVAQLPLVPED